MEQGGPEGGSPAVGRKFGKYEIVDELGRGAMGVVYKARDPLIGRLVALKTVMPGLLSSPDLLKRFHREAQSAGRLYHPNIVMIYDLGEADGLPYIAMELVEGESLQKIIARRAPLPLGTKVKIMVQICGGLGHAHQHGVVHRDVKPGNILVTPNGSVKIVDFGIVHLADTGMTQSGMVLGTVSYMSPEQLRGEQVDRRSDIFSVGMVMYELLAYQKPYDGPNVTSIMVKIATEEPPPLAELVPGLPSVLDDVVRKCLRKDREERFQTLEDMAFEIEPLARRLQREVVDAMVEESRDLLARKEFTRAEEMLRTALALDSGHDAAKGLMSAVQSELKRVKVSARVRHCVEDGQRLLDQKKYAEAAKSFEEALKLDSQQVQARDLLQQASAEAARATEIRKRMIAAKRALSEGDLTQAESELRKALEVEAGQAEVVDLLEKIREERAAQERRLRLREGIASARDLMRMEREDEARAQLEALQVDFPRDVEVDQLLAAVKQKLADRQEVRQAFDEVKALLEQQKFREAMTRAETVRFQFPKDAESTRLYNFARTEAELAERRQRLELEVTELQEQVKNQQYAEAIAHGERLQQEFPGSVEVARLAMLARSEKQAADRLERLEEARQSIQTLRDEGKLKEAERALEAALEAFPGDPSLERIRSALLEEMVGQLASSKTEPSGEAAGATSVFLARKAEVASISAGSEMPGSETRAGVVQPVSDSGAQAGSTAARAGFQSDLRTKRKSPVLAFAAAAVLILGLTFVAYKLFHNPPTLHVQESRSSPSPVPAASSLPAGSASAGESASIQATSAVSTASPAAAPASASETGEGSKRSPRPTANTSEASMPVKAPSARPPETRAATSKPVSTEASNLAAAASGGTGELVVTSNVDGANILINGADTGYLTPHTFSAYPTGQYNLALRKDGYRFAVASPAVKSGESITVNVPLYQAVGLVTLEVLEVSGSNPEGVPIAAQVTIDDKPYGQSPVKEISLPVGTHHYKVTIDSRFEEGSFPVSADGFLDEKIKIPKD